MGGCVFGHVEMEDAKHMIQNFSGIMLGFWKMHIDYQVDSCSTFGRPLFLVFSSFFPELTIYLEVD